MNTLSVGTNFCKQNNSPSFGMKIRENAAYFDFKKTMDNFSTGETDAFVELLKEEPVGGDKDAVELIFYPMGIGKNNYKGMPCIRYTFLREGQEEPIIPHYSAPVSKHEDMMQEIIDDGNRYASGADDKRIKEEEAEEYVLRVWEAAIKDAKRRVIRGEY